MNSVFFRRQVRLAISGAEGLANNLPLSSLRDFVLPFPPIEEANQIESAIRTECHELERAISTAEREISLLREYRTRLIADVVTGKLDVREAAARLPAEAEEPEPLDKAEALTEDDEDGTEADLEPVPEEVEA
jgi:type I restriction enzyme S subunit